MRIESAGKWLVAMSPSEVAYVDPERRALGDLMFEEGSGDRHTSLTVLVCGATPAEILDGLRGALLTDGEMANPDGWSDYDDPFGDWHEEPCDDAPGMAAEAQARGDTGGERQ
jgi:hypothetical protein